MAPDPPVSFDSIIQAGRADRDRKKAEQLASTIFSKTKTKHDIPTGPKRLTSSPSLASRITKPAHRSASSSSVSRARVESAYKKTSKVNGHGDSQGFNIKGAAGPYVVVGSNFAPGTSAADIRSAMEQIAGEMISCVIITSNPTVIAEMVFAEKEAAEMIVATFNNQKADGRLLHLYFKVGPPTRLEAAPQRLQDRDLVPNRSVDDRSDLFPDKLGTRGPRHTNVAKPEYHDGRYGFDSRPPLRNHGLDRDDYDGLGNITPAMEEDLERPGFWRDDQGYAGSSNSRPRSDRRPPTQKLYSDGLYSRSKQSHR